MKTQDSKLQHLNLVVKANLIPRFLNFLEHGFKLKIHVGLSIKELFCVHLGITDDYFDNRIQTLFLDGKPVDNADTARIFDGARVALSAAMPGLVGAVFRKGGHYASFRRTISHSQSGNSSEKDEGEILLKFFNMVAKELGPAFLRKGIIIEGERFQNFARRNSEDLNAGCESIHLNDAEIAIAKLKKIKWGDREVFLQVTSEADAQRNTTHKLP